MTIQNTQYEMPEQIWEYLPELNMQEQTLIKLKLENYTCKEIAEKLNISPAYVSKLYKNIIEKIKAANE